MQGLWSRAASSQLTCRCVSCLSTTASGVSSRSAANASKRRLRIGNSFTALYSSIFAAAALADARAKAQRRRDWEDKIAAVKAEVNELVDEEQRLIESLQSRRSYRGSERLLNNGVLGGISSTLSATARQRNVSRQPTRSFQTQRNMSSDTSTQTVEHFRPEDEHDESIWAEEKDDDHVRFDEAEDIEDIQARVEHMPKWVLDDPMRIKAIQMLALKQFAIRLLLRPTIAHRYYGLPMKYDRDFQVPHINVNNLLDELNNVRRRITELRTSMDSEYDDILGGIRSMGAAELEKRGQDLDNELQQDLQLYLSNQMSLEEIILRISENLLCPADPERSKAFRIILLTFLQTYQHDINDLLLRTILPHRFLLTASMVISILTHFRKSRNLKGFHSFLVMLTGEGWQANLGALAPYTRLKVNGIEIIVPPFDTNNPLVYSELISCALRFDQPDRADAWLQAARRVGFFDNFNTLFCYIKFYSIRQDWEKGLETLKRAVAYLVSSTGLQRHVSERLIVLMTHLCDSCGRKDVSAALISAAMHSGFCPSIAADQEDVIPITDPSFIRWTEAAKSMPKKNAGRPLWQSCSDFAHVFGNYLHNLEMSDGESRTKQLNLHAARYAQSTFRAHVSSKPSPVSQGLDTPEASDEVVALKKEVSELRELVVELRKHHITDSFRKDDPWTPSDRMQRKRSSKPVTSITSTSAPNPPPQKTSATPRSVKFLKVNSKQDLAEQDPLKGHRRQERRRRASP